MNLYNFEVLRGRLTSSYGQPKHPFWRLCDKDYWVASMLAYADSEEQILQYWPTAFLIKVQEANVTEYEFTSERPCPVWFKI